MYVHTETESLCFFAPDPFLIRSLIPQSRTLEHEDYNAVVRFTWDNIRVLQNLGFDPPVPNGYVFPGKKQPRAHQREMFDFYRKHFRCFNLSEPGTMKTKPTLWAADSLMIDGLVQRAAIMSTLSTLEPVWEQEIFDTVYHRTWAEAHGSPAKREAAMARNVDFFIFNHHGVVSNEIWRAVHNRKDINLVIVDEGAVFREPGTDMYKALDSMLRPDQRVWWLTGGPIPNEPADAWAQARIINPAGVPRHKGSFKRETMVAVRKHYWVPRVGHLEKVYAAMQPAIRFEKKDVLQHLPQKVVLPFQSKMSAEQAQHFKAMKNQMQAELSSGMKITAVNAADKIIKLRQILCIAKDTPVLTQRGWLPIQNILIADRIWDGVDWVRHSGVIDKGKQQITRCDGVLMTGGHEVLTQKGWRTADEQSSNRLNRLAVRLPGCPVATWHDFRFVAESHLDVQMRLWELGNPREPESESKEKAKREALRVSAQAHQCEAQDELYTALSNLDAYETALWRSGFQRLSKLRRERDKSLREVAKIIREFLGRYVRKLRGSPHTRPQKQRRKLHKTQLSLGNHDAASSQQTSKFSMVYDILNCGPRNQFVTRGSGGELLIVHNCGCIKDPVTGEYFTIDHKPSFNTLMEILESAKAKCIIIVPFKGIIRELHRELVKAGRTVGVVNGDVTPTARKQIFTAFKTQDDPHDLLCHPKVMAHGLNLTEADMLVNYAPITGNEDYGQVIERFDREGQKNKMTIARMARHPMEWDLYKSIDADAVTQQSIMDLYRKVMDT